MARRNHASIPVSADDARLLLMHAQGLLDDPSRRATPGALRALIRKLGFVQVDSINVLERAHHLTLRSRLEDYRKAHLKTLAEKQRRLFEHWTHDASMLPVEYFSHWHHRRRRIVENPRVERWVYRRIGDDPARVLDATLKRIEAEGQLQSRDFEHPGRASGSWWGWKPAKAALEYLWWRGDLAVAGRRNFQKVYDLAPRVYPDHHALPAPDADAFIDLCCTDALERLGVATHSEIAAFFGAIHLKESRDWCERAMKDALIVEVETGSRDGAPSRRAFALPDIESRIERARTARSTLDDRSIRLLSPFDPVIRDRKRCERLFGFDYRFEAFVPAPKRKYGYYVLPILRGDALIGRTDLKFNRKTSTVEVRGVWWEPAARRNAAVSRDFDDALHALAAFLGAGWVEYA